MCIPNLIIAHKVHIVNPAICSTICRTHLDGDDIPLREDGNLDRPTILRMLGMITEDSPSIGRMISKLASLMAPTFPSMTTTDA